MTSQTARNQFANHQAVLAAGVCALAVGIVLQFFGNATQGYIHSRSLFYWWGSQWFDPAAEMQHGPLVALVAVWLFWRNLRSQGASAVASEPAGWRAPAALLAGLALHLVGYAAQQTRISIAAMLLFLWGVLMLAGGRRWGRAAVFPLGFMLLAVPVSFVDSLGFSLRLVVTDNAYALAQRFGISLVRNGTQLFSPDGRFQYDVAAACSGIRSLVALLALALLVGYIGFRSWVARAVLVAAGLPYVVIGNIVRVLAIVVVGEKYGQTAGGRVHEASGVVVFLVVLGLLLATVALLRRVGFKPVEQSRVHATEAEAPVVGASLFSRPWVVAATVVGVAGVVCLAAWRLDARQVGSVAGVRLTADGASPVDLPDFVGTGWMGRPIAVTEVEREVLPGDTGYSRKNYVSLSNVEKQVFVSVVLSGRDRTSIHRPELCLVGQGWTIAGRFRHEFQAGGEAVPATVLRVEHAAVDAQGRRVQVNALFAYWFVGGEAVVPTLPAMQWRDACDRLRHFRANRWAYVVVQSAVRAGDEPAALASMQEIVAGAWPEIRGEPVRP
jgi:exosortase